MSSYQKPEHDLKFGHNYLHIFSTTFFTNMLIVPRCTARADGSFFKYMHGYLYFSLKIPYHAGV